MFLIQALENFGGHLLGLDRYSPGDQMNAVSTQVVFGMRLDQVKEIVHRKL